MMVMTMFLVGLLEKWGKIPRKNKPEGHFLYQLSLFSQHLKKVIHSNNLSCISNISSYSNTVNDVIVGRLRKMM